MNFLKKKVKTTAVRLIYKEYQIGRQMTLRLSRLQKLGQVCVCNWGFVLVRAGDGMSWIYMRMCIRGGR